MTSASERRRYDAVKRVLDVTTATAALIALWPVLAVVAALVSVRLGRPVIFRQDRPGRDGNVFRLYKFRTMRDVDIARGLITDEQRLTPFGLALRSTSLDELPTLVNVIKGDMSIVGPRPLLVRYLARYSPEQSRRHEVRPGITGLAQVSGRNALAWKDKFELDVDYVETRSFRGDLRILRMTVLAVAKRSGVSADGHATAPEFMGTNLKLEQRR